MGSSPAGRTISSRLAAQISAGPARRSRRRPERLVEELDGACLGEFGGGTEIRYSGRDVIVITPQSPLGRRKGDIISFGRDATERRIVGVS